MKITVAKIETIEVDSMENIPDGLHVVLSKEDAQKLAQDFVAKAMPYIMQAQRLADTFRFAIHNGTRVYLPDDLTPAEREWDGILSERIGPYVQGGEWMTSSGWKDC